MILEHSSKRKIVFSCFHPDICTMMRLKQNRYPVMFLTQGVSEVWPPYEDQRCSTIHQAILYATNADILVSGGRGSEGQGPREREGNRVSEGEGGKRGLYRKKIEIDNLGSYLSMFFFLPFSTSSMTSTTHSFLLSFLPYIPSITTVFHHHHHHLSPDRASTSIRRT